MPEKRPNILFLMTDQMQGKVLRPESQCMTPNLDKLADRGIRFDNAYTSNAVCSPARAGIMTGLLPHNHGVYTVTHCVQNDMCNLRTEHPHWAQGLRAAGYKTGYFGKWHIEESGDISQFGWDFNRSEHSPEMKKRFGEFQEKYKNTGFSMAKHYDTPGYAESLFFGVQDIPPQERKIGMITSEALTWLDSQNDGDPWCCFVSVPEPHDPFITSREYFDMYTVDDIRIFPNVFDELEGRPGIYKKAARIWKDMTERRRKEAAACYYASITEIDAQFGKILDKLEQKGELDNTVIIMTADHGEMLGSHGMYCKNFSASEEIYNIPLIAAGPGIQGGIVTGARVGSHDLAPTICDLTDIPSIGAPDSKSFSAVLKDPLNNEKNFTQGFAEFEGTRYHLSQRIIWMGNMKFVHNGFDIDELYDLEKDPYEMNNLIEDVAYRASLKRLVKFMWKRIKETGDKTLLNTNYPILRLAPFGPGILDE